MQNHPQKTGVHVQFGSDRMWAIKEAHYRMEIIANDSETRRALLYLVAHVLKSHDFA